LLSCCKLILTVSKFAKKDTPIYLVYQEFAFVIFHSLNLKGMHLEKQILYTHVLGVTLLTKG